MDENLFKQDELHFSAGFNINLGFSNEQTCDSTKMSPYEEAHTIFDWKENDGFVDDIGAEPIEFLHQQDVIFDNNNFNSSINFNNYGSHSQQNFPMDREKILFPGDVEPLRVSSSIQTDNVLKRITQARSVLINGEKEILGKNIISLHSLNELCTNDNCQITSTVINGKRYKIIIRAKSAQNNLSNGNSPNQQKTMENIKKSITEDDTLITELQNGVYDVLDNSDELVVHPWELSPMAEDEDENDSGVDKDFHSQTPKVPPLRIKLPKVSQKKKKKKSKSRLSQPVSNLVENVHQFGTTTTQSKQSITEIGDSSVQLDHDYCSATSPKSISNDNLEKNPKKDSGIESNEGTSDASADSPTAEFPQTFPDLPTTSKLIEERRRSKNHADVTKVAAQFFRAANAVAARRRAMTGSSVSCVTSLGLTVAQNNCDSNTENNDSKNDLTDEVEQRPKKKLKLEEYLSRRPVSKPIKDDVPDSVELDENEICVIKECVRKNKDEPALIDNKKDYDSVTKRERSVDSPTKQRTSSFSPDRRRCKKVTRRSVSRDKFRSSSRSSSSSSDSSGHWRYYSSPRRSRRSRSRSFSRSGNRSKVYSRSARYYNKRSRSPGSNSWSRNNVIRQQQKQKPIEERRVIYVGRIEDGLTSQQLRQRFAIFGPIDDVSVHFREHGENYGFVTFKYKDDAFEALEHGNDHPNFPVYDLSFGGRRTFCRQRYSDLDGMPTSFSEFVDRLPTRPIGETFDLLLKKAKEKLLKNR